MHRLIIHEDFTRQLCASWDEFYRFLRGKLRRPGLRSLKWSPLFTSLVMLIHTFLWNSYRNLHHFHLPQERHWSTEWLPCQVPIHTWIPPRPNTAASKIRGQSYSPCQLLMSKGRLIGKRCRQYFPPWKFSQYSVPFASRGPPCYEPCPKCSETHGTSRIGKSVVSNA